MTMMLGFHQQKFPHGLFDIFPWLLDKVFNIKLARVHVNANPLVRWFLIFDSDSV
jgi:hypothetical protein